MQNYDCINRLRSYSAYHFVCHSAYQHSFFQSDLVLMLTGGGESSSATYFSLKSTFFMMQIFETDLLSQIAREVCDELYSVAKTEPRIMVNDWTAFAVLAMYRELSLVLGGGHVPTIDECFAGEHEPRILANNPKWRQLKAWHSEHWSLSQEEEWEQSYIPFIFRPTLRLEHYVLTM